MALQPESPPSPQSASGVHRVECTLSWELNYYDKSTLFAERVFVYLQVDFDEVEGTDEGIKKELYEFFINHLGWVNYEGFGLTLDEWKIAADD